MSAAVPPSVPPPPPSGRPPEFRWPAELDAEYECLGELGRGGMAIVYHARDRELSRDVAIKVVRTRYANDSEAVARLAREARTVAHLEHPNLVALHAVKRLTDDSLALVMQLVPGKTLKQALRDDGPFDPERVERVLRDIARALAYAHARGIVHRDVKPENIFLDAESGRALLSDFGVAISREADTSLTATGTTIGTPTYMSPEQIDGARVDGRSDLYSLGLVAWEMLTGRRPWDGENLYSVIYRQKHEELPPIEESRTDVPERLRYIVDGLLRKQPAARWASAERLLHRLNDAGDPPGLRQWRAYKRRQLKQRRDAAKAAPVEVSLPEAPTQHFRRSAEQRAVRDEQVDDRATPQTIRVDTSATASDEWSVEDETRGAGTGRYRRWAIAAVVLALAGVTALALSRRTPAPVVTQAEAPRATFSDAGAIEVPAIAPADSATARGDSAVAAALRAPDSGAARVSVPVARQLPAAPVPSLTTAGTTAAARPPRDSAPVVRPNERPASPGLAFPRERALVSPGARHSCSLNAAGKASCWGSNDRGQLGDNSDTQTNLPVPVVGDFTFSHISAGDAFTCGVTTGGEALCWGNNDVGQLGDGTTVPRNAPVRVSGGHSFQVVRAGRDHACGVTSGAALVCWGSNRDGQLGDGTRTSRSSPVRVTLPAPAARVAPGGSHTCALLNDGTPYCWGANGYGQLGDSSKTADADPVRVATSLRFVSITSGRDHSCAVTTDNEAYCWGRNSTGQAGVASGVESVLAPQRVETSVRFASIVAGWYHTCGRAGGGTAYCWGANVYGQLGDGTTTRHIRPVAVQGAGSLIALYAGASHTCGVNSSNETLCWGYNVDGQLGSGGRENSVLPVKVPEQNR